MYGHLLQKSASEVHAKCVPNEASTCLKYDQKKIKMEVIKINGCDQL